MKLNGNLRVHYLLNKNITFICIKDSIVIIPGGHGCDDGLPPINSLVPKVGLVK